jgi:hypothetical protein
MALTLPSRTEEALFPQLDERTWQAPPLRHRTSVIAALMISVGIRRTMLGGLGLMAGATLASLWMRVPWQYVLIWGVEAGLPHNPFLPLPRFAVLCRLLYRKCRMTMRLPLGLV